MRKYQRQQIENRVESLHAYHQESRKHLSQNVFSMVKDILGRCQKLAIEIGESIEQAEGEGTETVSFLEQYCERVYLVSPVHMCVCGHSCAHVYVGGWALLCTCVCGWVGTPGIWQEN